MDTVYTIRELNMESCTYAKPEKFTSDGKLVTDPLTQKVAYNKSFVNMHGQRGFILQTPKLILRDSSDSCLDLLVSKNKDRHKEFYHIISHLEDIAIVQIADNSLEWFGTKISRSQVEVMFRSSIHRPLEIDDPFIFKVNKANNLSDVELNFPVTCLIRFDGIIFGRNSSILDMKVIQIKVNKPEKIPSVSGEQELEPTQNTQAKSFYADNVSVAPSNYQPRIEPEQPQVPDAIDEETEDMNQLIADEKVITLEKPRTLPPPSPQRSVAKSVATVPTLASIVTAPVLIPSAPTPTPTSTAPTLTAPIPMNIDKLKCSMMKAMVENDYEKIQELSKLLKSHDVV